MNTPPGYEQKFADFIRICAEGKASDMSNNLWPGLFRAGSLLLALLCHFVLVAAADETNQPANTGAMVQLTNYLVCNVVTHWTGPRRDFAYFFTGEQCRLSTPWDPKTQPWRFDLGKEARHAMSSFARNNPTTEAELRQIQILRLSAALPANPGTQLSNSWFTVFSFWTKPIGMWRCVVQLPDGPQAVEQDQSLIHDERTLSSSFLRSPFYKQYLSRPESLGVDPFEATQSPKFRSTVQWNPLFQEFPLSMETERIRAEKYIKGRLALPTIQLTLNEVSIDHFLTLGDISKNQNHWLVSFRFSDELQPEGGNYLAYELLDGTFLQPQ